MTTPLMSCQGHEPYRNPIIDEACAAVESGSLPTATKSVWLTITPKDYQACRIAILEAVNACAWAAGIPDLQRTNQMTRLALKIGAPWRPDSVPKMLR